MLHNFSLFHSAGPIIVVVVIRGQNSNQMEDGADHHKNVEKLMRGAKYIKFSRIPALGKPFLYDR
jgi:hypothetical protein